MLSSGNDTRTALDHRPMRDHVLLQVISRVNRPYEDAQGRQKPCGLIIDFIGMLRDLNKALAFDSQDVSGVIEDLDLLLVEFRRLLTEAAATYLAPLVGGKDKQLEHLLCDVLLDPGARQDFIDRYRQIEGLYEILSPSPELRGHIDAFRKLIDLYLMVRNAYSSPSRFYEDVARKTQNMIRETAARANSWDSNRSRSQSTGTCKDRISRRHCWSRRRSLRRKPGIRTMPTARMNCVGSKPRSTAACCGGRQGQKWYPSVMRKFGCWVVLPKP